MFDILEMNPFLKKIWNKKSQVDYGWSRYRLILIGCRWQFEFHSNLASEQMRPAISVADKFRDYIDIYVSMLNFGVKLLCTALLCTC